MPGRIISFHVLHEWRFTSTYLKNGRLFSSTSHELIKAFDLDPASYNFSGPYGQSLVRSLAMDAICISDPASYSPLGPKDNFLSGVLPWMRFVSMIRLHSPSGL